MVFECAAWSFANTLLQREREIEEEEEEEEAEDLRIGQRGRRVVDKLLTNFGGYRRGSRTLIKMSGGEVSLTQQTKTVSFRTNRQQQINSLGVLMCI